MTLIVRSKGITTRRLALNAGAVAAALSVLTSPAWSQVPDTVQRSSSPQGFHIQGNVPTGGAAASNSAGSATASKDNSSASAGTVAAGNSKVQLQGNTRINAAATNTNATALGQGNKAGNDLGGIGNK
jgi:hypothetical protein